MERAQRFIRIVCNARMQLVFDCLGRLELEAPVHIEILGGLLDRFERIESLLNAATVINEPNIDADNTLRVEVNKIF